MGNNKITNLGNPGSANDAVSKRFLYKRIHKLTTDYNLESVSDNIDSIKNEIAEMQQSLLSNRKSKMISNDQELIQSDPISCPQNQKGNN